MQKQLILWLLPLWFMPMAAQEPIDTCIEINEVMVTGLTGTTKMKYSPSPISVVGNQTLNSTLSTNIIDAISLQPGIAQVTTGGGISKPVIRGLGYNRVVVIDDGIRQEGQQWGDEHGVEVDGASVHSVEIIKGPASLRYGSDALAGVIIFHDEPVEQAGEMHANYQTEFQSNSGLFGNSIVFRGNKSNIFWNVRASHKMAHAYKNKYDGYVAGSQFRERALSGLIGKSASYGRNSLRLSYYHLTPGLIEGERDAETGELLCDGNVKTYGHGMPYQQVKHYKAVSDNTFFVGNTTLKAVLSYQQNIRQEYEDGHHHEEGETHETDHHHGTSPSLDFRLHTIGYDVYATFPELRGWQLVSGVGGMWQRSLNKGFEYLIPAYSLFDFGIFTTASRHFGKWHVSGGLRYDTRRLHGEQLLEDGDVRFSDFTRRFNGLTGSAGVIVNLDRNWNVRLNIARGFRAPNMSELGSNGAHEGALRYELGDHNLKSEFSTQLDFGVDYTSQQLILQLSLFANRIDNYIFIHKLQADGQTVYADGRPVFQYDGGDALLSGGELAIEWHPIHCLHVNNAMGYVYAIQLHQPKTSRYLPFTPAPRWIANIRYDLTHEARVFANAYVALGWECNLRQNHYRMIDDTETPTPSYTLFNAAVATDIHYRKRHIATLTLTAQNLLDKAYQSHLSRLKYGDVNTVSGRTGVFNMGRSISLKVNVMLF